MKSGFVATSFGCGVSITEMLVCRVHFLLFFTVFIKS